MKKTLIGLACLASTGGCATAEPAQPSAANNLPEETHTDQIVGTLEARMSDFTACYEAEAKRKPPGPAGWVKTAFTVEISGTVSAASIQNTTLKNRAIQSCILKVIKSIQFPPRPISAGPAHVTYPFKFAPSKVPADNAGEPASH